MKGYSALKKSFGDELYQLEKNNDNGNFKEWLVKSLIPLEKKMKKITNVKRKKLQKLSGEGDIKELVSDRFTEHLGLFTFFNNFLSILRCSLQIFLILLIW